MRPGSVHAIGQSFDANGNVIAFTNRRGGTISYAYDALDRVTSRVADGATTSFSYGLNYLAASNSESADTLWFNSAEQNSSISTGRPTNGAWYKVAYTYNTDGSLYQESATSNRWQGARAQTYTYDASLGLKYLDSFAGRTTVLWTVDGLPTSVTFANGLVRNATFVQDHEFASQSFSNNSVNNALGLDWGLDSLGRITQRVRNLGDSLAILSYTSDGRFQSMTQYTGASCSSDPSYGVKCSPAGAFAWSENHSYDAVGNVDPEQMTYQGNRLTANGNVQYDEDGNMINEWVSGILVHSLQWNTLGQLTSVTTNGTTVQFGYDAFGKRVRKTAVGGNDFQYLWDRGDLLMQLAGGTLMSEFAYLPGGDQPLAMWMTGGQVYYFSTDAISGSVKGLVRASDNTVMAKYGYSMFGGTQGGFDNVGWNPLRFAGREYDEETGFVYFRNRYYYPAWGRFISEDPLGLKGGINPYLYASGDPVNRRDPSGLDDCDASKPGVCIGGVTIEGKGGTDDGPTVEVIGTDHGPSGFGPGPSSGDGGGGATSAGTTSSTTTASGPGLNACLAAAIGNGLAFGGWTGFVAGARMGLTRGLEVATSQAVVRAAVVVGVIATIGTFEAGGSGGPVSYALTRGGEYLGIVGGYTLAYGLAGAVTGSAIAIAGNIGNCATDASSLK